MSSLSRISLATSLPHDCCSLHAEAAPLLGGDVAGANDSGPVASTINDEATEAPAEQTAPPAPSEATGTLTLSTGETFELSVGMCDTQANDPNSLLNDDFVEISADTAEGHCFTVLKARSVESAPARAQVGLNDERDENGVNPAINYVSLGVDDDPSLTPIEVDGVRVSGLALLDGKFSSNKVFGETVNATFNFVCD
jgi:hypothetical protein